MNRLFFVILVFLFPIITMAQDTLHVLPYGCDNGAQTTWLSVTPGNITVKIMATLGGPRTIKCLLNGQEHHTQDISGSGEVVITYEGVGLGNPDHNITLSPWDGSTQTGAAVSVGQIFPWVHVPNIHTVPTLVTDTMFRWNTVHEPFSGMPNSGIGGCFEHRIFLIEELVSEDGNQTLFDTILGVAESMSTVEHTFEWINTGAPTTVCTRTELVRMDVGTTEPADFEPQYISLTTEEVCETIGLLTTGIPEVQTGGSIIYPNPFEDHFTITLENPVQYTIITLGGQVVGGGNGAQVRGEELPTGTYVLRVTTHARTHVQRIVRY